MDKNFKYDILRQRRVIYRWLIKRIDMGKKFYICIALGHRLNPKQKIPDVLEVLPEIERQSPHRHLGVYTWYSWAPTNKEGMQFRRRRILKAIELVNKKIAKEKEKKLQKHKTEKK